MNNDIIGNIKGNHEKNNYNLGKLKYFSSQ